MDTARIRALQWTPLLYSQTIATVARARLAQCVSRVSRVLRETRARAAHYTYYMHGILKVRSERSTVCTILTVRIHDGQKTNSAQKHFSCTIVNTHITEQVWLFWVQQI